MTHLNNILVFKIAKTGIIYQKNVRAKAALGFTQNE
jgi:hypothetical protein